MKKKYIQLGAVSLALLAMVGALILLRREPAADSASPSQIQSDADDIIYIYGDASTKDDIPEQIDIHNEYGDTVIDNPQKDGAAAEPVVRGWEKLSLDAYGLNEAVSNAKAMQAKEIISENATADDLVIFGLDNPRATLTVYFKGGSTPTILFGENAPGGEGVYVKLKNEDKIYLISDGVALPYFKPATAFVNKTITATDPEFKGFSKITLSGTNYPEPLVIERTPETQIEAAGMILNTHSFTSPIKRGVDSQRGLAPLSSVYGLLGNDVVAVDDSAEALEKYGLKDPATVVSVVGDTPEMTFTLRISSPDDNGEVHLIKSGSKVIYELSPGAMPFLQLSMFDMMDRMVVVPSIKNVSKVVLTTAQNKYEFVLTQEDGTDKLDVTVNGAPLPDVVDESGKSVTGGENFRKLYQTMIGCRYDEPIPNSDTEAKAAETLEASEDETSGAETLEAEASDAETASTETSEIEASDTEILDAETSENTDDAPFLASIEYIYNNGNPSDVVSFYGAAPRKVEIKLNGEGGYYGQSVYLDRLLEDAEKAINGIPVQPYL